MVSKLRIGSPIVLAWFALFTACSDDHVTERVDSVTEALSTNDRILNFEGTIGGTNPDWHAVVGTAAASTIHSEGSHSMALGGNTNPEAISAALSALGSLTGTPNVDVELQTGYQNQGSYWGQIALFVTCSSANIFNQSVGTVALSSPTGSFKHYSFPALPSNVATALSTVNGCTADVRLNLSNTGSVPVLVDKLSFGQTSGGGSGGSGGTGGSAGNGASAGSGATGGKAGAAGSTSGAGAGGKAGAGAAGQAGGGHAGTSSGGAGQAGSASGTGGAGAGAGGAGGGGTATSVEFFIELPVGVDRKSVALAAYGGALLVDDGFHVVVDGGGFASVSSVNTTAATTIGASADVHNVWSQANVALRTNAHVHNDVFTSGVLQAQNPVLIDGVTEQSATLTPIKHQGWTVVFPATHQAGVTLGANQTASIGPGAYGAVALGAGSKLTLAGAGTYTFDGNVSLQPQAILDIDNTQSDVQIYVHGTLIFQGQIAPRNPALSNVMIGVAGTSAITIGAPFRGVLVAPYADVSLASATGSGDHYGTVFAHSISAHGSTTLHFSPLDPRNFCDTATCSGLCPCTAPRPCTGDGDCNAGYTCGLNQGPRFGNDPGTNVCWPIHCNTDAAKTSCGSYTAACGLCNLPQRDCTSDSQCLAGEACTPGNGTAFGNASGSVCWPQICTTAARKNFCGGPNAPCGQCDCSANCTNVTCGGDMSDGCGGQCPNVCDDRQPGCATDGNCKNGSICITGGGPRIGLPLGINICLPNICGVLGNPTQCGALEAACGLCPVCTPQCDGKCGGASDLCGGTCDGTCPEGFSCVGGGVCAQRGSSAPVQIPDGNGGTKTVEPLDPGPTADVGATPASFSVSDSGKAIYRIPIVEPPGRLGVQPSIALTYGGTTRNGALGTGWYVEGLSNISRCRHTTNEDGFAAQIADDASDRYCLDGVLLQAGPGQTYGADGAIHFPEFDPQTRVISYGTDPHGPSYFKVWRANGLIYTYGKTPDSVVYADVDAQIGRQWAVNRIEDHLGNFIRVNYYTSGPDDTDGASPDRGTRIILPQSIDYTGFDGPGALGLRTDRHVYFNYETDVRPDWQFGFAYNGHTVWRQWRLGEVLTTVDDTTASDYFIQYGDEIGEDAQNGVSRIATITECVNGDCKQPTHFEYYDEGATPFADPIFTGMDLSGGYLDWRNAIAVFDADGDGIDDILYQTYVSENVSEPFGLGTLTYTNVISPRWGLLMGQPNSSAPFVKRDFGPYIGASNFHCDAAKSPNPNWSNITGNSVIDWNLDGKDDLIDWWQFDRVKLRTIFGDTFTSAQTIDSGPSGRGDCSKHEDDQLADVNGDGFADLIYYSYEDNATHLYLRDPLNPQTFKAPITFQAQNLVAQNPSDDRFGRGWIDFDGDGAPERIDSLPANLEVTWVRPDLGTATKRSFVGSVLPTIDWNGDGLKDGLPSPATPIYLNHGGGQTGLGGYTSFHGQTNRLAFEQQVECVIADFNHDGKEDVLVPRLGYFWTWDAYSLGWGTDQNIHVSATLHSNPNDLEPTKPPPGLFGNFTSNRGALLGDFDGDGNLDFTEQDFTDVPFVAGRGFKTNLMKTITDGAGKQIDINYAAGSPKNGAAGVYTAGTNCGPLRCERRVGPIVSSYAESQAAVAGLDAPRTEHRTTYSYSDGRTNPADQRFIGFASRTIQEFDGDQKLLRTTIVQYDNSTRAANGVYPLAGKETDVTVAEPSVQSALTPNTSTSRLTDTKYTWVIGTTAGAGLYPVLTDKVTQTSEAETPQGQIFFHVTPVATVHEQYTTDAAFNNVTHVTRTESAASALATTDLDIPPRTDTGFLNDWLIDLPDHRTITDKVLPAGTQQTRTVQYDYYPSGLQKQVIREPNDDYYRLERDFNRNGYGNVHTVTEISNTNGLTGPGRTRTSTTIYDDDEVFPLTVTNSVGQTTYLDFDRRFGAPTLVSDANGIATQWAFDGFGRTTVEVTPETTSLTTYSADTFLVGNPIPVRAVLKASTQTMGFGEDDVSVDAFGREVSHVSSGLLGELVYTETEYDGAGRLSRTSRPHVQGDTSQGFTEYQYNAAGHLAKVIPADATSTLVTDYATRASVSPPDIGLPSLPDNYVSFSQVTLPNGGKEISVTDARGEVVASRDAKGNWVTAAFGPFSTPTTVTSDGETTQTQFDLLGRVKTTIDPDRGTEVYQYTAWDDLDAYFAGSAIVPRLKYDYDDIGRVKTISSITDGSATYAYDFDGGPNEIGRLVSATSFDGTTRTFGYEAVSGSNRGLLNKVTDTVDDVQMVTGLTYNAFGQVDTVTYPGGSEPFRVENCYDSAGNLNSVGRPGGTGGTCGNLEDTFWSLSESDDGQRPSVERIGSMTTTKTYFPLTGQLNELNTFPTFGGTSIQQEGHTYDADGNLHTRNSFTEAAGLTSETFNPDVLDRLNNVTEGNLVSFLAGYADDGNVTSLSGAGTITYNNPNSFPLHAPDTSNGASYTYNSLGGRRTMTGAAIVGGTQTTTYDSLEQVTHIGLDAGPISALDFKYQLTGERAKKSATGGSTTVYSGDYERTTSAAGVVEHKYRIRSPSGAFLEITRDDSAANAELSRAYLYADLMGSPEVITDQAGNVLHRQSFGPFGTTSSPTSLSNDPAVRRVTRGFTGHEYDAETGLINMGARFYDPRIARFTSPDFGVQEPSWTQAYNRYAYAWNNPHAWVDPLGLDNASICGDDGCIDLGPYDPIVVSGSDNGATTTETQESSEPDQTWDALTEGPEESPDLTQVPPISLDPSEAPSQNRHDVLEEFPGARDDGAPKTDSEIVSNILHQAMENPECGIVESCGPTPWQVNTANTSNILNHPGKDAADIRDVAERIALERRISRDAIEDDFWKFVDVALAATAHTPARQLLSSAPKLVDTSAVRFTQSSVSQALKNGENINDVIKALKGPGGDALARYFKPIRIFKQNGRLLTLDNRRLLIFSEAGRPVPYVWATRAEVAAEAWKSTATAEQAGGWLIRVGGGK